MVAESVMKTLWYLYILPYDELSVCGDIPFYAANGTEPSHCRGLTLEVFIWQNTS